MSSHFMTATSAWFIRNFYTTVIVIAGLLMTLVSVEISKRSILAEIHINRSKGDVILEAIEKKTADRWTKHDHDKWLSELQQLNPQLKLPEGEK